MSVVMAGISVGIAAMSVVMAGVSYVITAMRRVTVLLLVGACCLLLAIATASVSETWYEYKERTQALATAKRSKRQAGDFIWIN